MESKFTPPSGSKFPQFDRWQAEQSSGSAHTLPPPPPPLLLLL
jgi:hypothetical protein